ncbi:hypothetical protein FQN55_005822, partial [Onygenales sp. PD_40]
KVEDESKYKAKKNMWKKKKKENKKLKEAKKDEEENIVLLETDVNWDKIMMKIDNKH